VHGRALDRPDRQVDALGGRGLIEAIDHVGLAVADLDAAVDLHTRVLGWRLVHTETNHDQQVTEAVLETGDGTGAQLQLMAPLNENSVIARFLDRKGPGLQQVAYRVSDVAVVSTVLRERGLRLLYDEPRSGTAGTLINFVHPQDTFGVLIELVEHPALPVGGQPAEAGS